MVWEVPDAEARRAALTWRVFLSHRSAAPSKSHRLDSGRALHKPSKANTLQIKYLKGEGGGGGKAWGVNPFKKPQQPSLDELVN